MVEIKPKVIQDYTAILDQFPCTTYIRKDLYYLVSFSLCCIHFGVFQFKQFIFRFQFQFQVHVLARLRGNETKIDACMIREAPGNWEQLMHENPLQNTKEFMEYLLQGLETVLSIRLPDETYRGIIDFLRATIPGKPINDIEKALVSERIISIAYPIENLAKHFGHFQQEYLYDDVPETMCF